MSPPQQALDAQAGSGAWLGPLVMAPAPPRSGLDLTSAQQTLVDRGVRHLLSLLKMTGTFFAKILVCWQEISPFHHLKSIGMKWHDMALHFYGWSVLGFAS
jgi:hypothetical protein